MNVSMTCWTRSVGAIASCAALICGVLTGLAAAAPAGSPATSHGVFAWGSDADGQTGNASLATRRFPSALHPTTGGVGVLVGENADYVLTATGQVLATGGDYMGQLGAVVPSISEPGGEVLAERAQLALVPGPSHVTQLATDGEDTFALTSAGKVWGWGIGTGLEQRSADPVPPSLLPGLAHVVGLAAGGTHAVAVLANGKVVDWGDGAGFLGRFRPTAVPGLAGIVEVAAGQVSSFAIDAAGRAWAWGDNTDGALGLASLAAYRTPTAISGLPPIRSISSSGLATLDTDEPSTLAVTKSGQVWSWGQDGYGQAGRGARETIASPGAVPGLSDVVAASAGVNYAVAADSAGRLWSWGEDDASQLGDGSIFGTAVPTLRSRLHGVTAVSAGDGDTMAVAAPAALTAPPGVITFEGSYGVEPSEPGALTLFLPTRARVGDLALAVVVTSCGDPADPAPGWKLVSSGDDSTGSACGEQWIYRQWVRSGERRPQLFDRVARGALGGVIDLFYGVSTTRPFEAHNSRTTEQWKLVDVRGFQLLEVRPSSARVTVPFSETVSVATGPSPLGALAGDEDQYCDDQQNIAIADGTLPMRGTSLGVPFFLDYEPGSVGEPAVIDQLVLRPAAALRVG